MCSLLYIYFTLYIFYNISIFLSFSTSISPSIFIPVVQPQYTQSFHLLRISTHSSLLLLYCCSLSSHLLFLIFSLSSFCTTFFLLSFMSLSSPYYSLSLSYNLYDISCFAISLPISPHLSRSVSLYPFSISFSHTPSTFICLRSPPLTHLYQPAHVDSTPDASAKSLQSAQRLLPFPFPLAARCSLHATVRCRLHVYIFRCSAALPLSPSPSLCQVTVVSRINRLK